MNRTYYFKSLSIVKPEGGYLSPAEIRIFEEYYGKLTAVKYNGKVVMVS